MLLNVYFWHILHLFPLKKVEKIILTPIWAKSNCSLLINNCNKQACGGKGHTK